MSMAILDRLTYVSVIVYLVFVLVEGWTRLVPAY